MVACCPTIEHIVSRAAFDEIHTSLAKQLIVTVTAKQMIRALPSGDVVVARSARDLIVTVVTPQQIVASTTDQNVVAHPTMNLEVDGQLRVDRDAIVLQASVSGDQRNVLIQLAAPECLDDHGTGSWSRTQVVIFGHVFGKEQISARRVRTDIQLQGRARFLGQRHSLPVGRGMLNDNSRIGGVI